MVEKTFYININLIIFINLINLIRLIRLIRTLKPPPSLTP